MTSLTLTAHAAMRMAQRGVMPKDSELIVLIGTQVDDGYIVRNGDYQNIEREIKQLLQRLRRIVGKRLIVRGDKIVTVYQPASRKQRYALRYARERGLGN